MTKFNLKDKIHTVDKLFTGKTDLWISKAVKKFIHKNRRNNEFQQFIAKVEEYSKDGFEHHECKKCPIRPEWDDVFRVGHKETLIRLLGFYNDGKKEFIAIDAMLKRGTTLSKAEKKRVNEVASVKKQKRWRKR